MDKNFKENGESTIFSAPAPHNDKPTKKGGKNAKTIILAVLCLMVSIGVLCIVLFLIPSKEDANTDNTVAATNCTEENIEEVNYTDKNGEEFKFIRISTPNFNTKGYSWVIDGIEAEKQDKNTANELVEYACSLKGIKMDDTENDIYGFSSPQAIISFSDKEDDYTITVGSTVGTDSYIKVSGKKGGIYRIDRETAEKLIKGKLDFATRDAYSIATFSADVSAYKSSGGSLERFDLLELESKDYTLSFTLNENELTKNYSKFLLSGKYSENGDKLFSVFTDTLYIDGAYSYFDDSASIEKSGLNNPDFTLSLKVGSETKWFKFKSVDDTFCAVLSDDRHLITRVKKENIPFWELERSDYLYKSLLPFGADDVAALNTDFNGKSSSLIAKESADKINEVLESIKTLNPEYASDTNGGAALLKMEFTLSDNTRESITFYSTDTTKIYVETNSFSGVISSTAFARLKKINESI